MRNGRGRRRWRRWRRIVRSWLRRRWHDMRLRRRRMRLSRWNIGPRLRLSWLLRRILRLRRRGVRRRNRAILLRWRLRFRICWRLLAGLTFNRRVNCAALIHLRTERRHGFFRRMRIHISARSRIEAHNSIGWKINWARWIRWMNNFLWRAFVKFARSQNWRGCGRVCRRDCAI